MGKLDKKVCLITGCASGIGRQLAIRFADEGARLAICDIQEERLMETGRLCEEKGAQVLAMRCDVSVYENLAAFVNAAVDRFGTVDVLVNNAHKITPPRPYLEQSVDDLEVELRTSLFAIWNLQKLCFPFLKDKPGVGASIVNFASKAGVEGTSLYAAYAAAKEGIRGLSRVTAREWGAHKIRVNTICPNGWTDNVEDALNKGPKEMRDWVERAFVDNPFQRRGDPYNDVAPVAVFLASDDSHWITGQNIHADGGVWIGA